MNTVFLGTFRKTAFERQDKQARYARALIVFGIFAVLLASCAGATKLSEIRIAQLEDARV